MTNYVSVCLYDAMCVDDGRDTCILASSTDPSPLSLPEILTSILLYSSHHIKGGERTWRKQDLQDP